MYAALLITVALGAGSWEVEGGCGSGDVADARTERSEAIYFHLKRSGSGKNMRR